VDLLLLDSVDDIAVDGNLNLLNLSVHDRALDGDRSWRRVDFDHLLRSGDDARRRLNVDDLLRQVVNNRCRLGDVDDLMVHHWGMVHNGRSGHWAPAETVSGWILSVLDSLD
jgi:hypothetical protein